MEGWFAQFVDIAFGCELLINASLFIPQIIKLRKTKSAEGLSLITFAGFNLVQIFGVAHGCVRNDWPLILGFGVSFALCGAVTLGILMYGDKTRPRRKNGD